VGHSQDLDDDDFEEFITDFTDDDDCNRTDQIIRAQVRKQAPKRSNFQT
jgi:hypothetical protein